MAARYPADQVEYIHRLHPLAHALAEYALDQLTVEPARNRFASRIAARRHPLAERPLALFTFIERQTHPQGHVFAVAIAADGEVLPSDTASRLLADATTPVGEVHWSECERAFATSYPSLRAKATAGAQLLLRQIAERERTRLNAFARTLCEEAALYKVDRLAEIDDEEAAERAGTHEQAELFGETRTNWRARRAAIDTIYTQRLAEIDRVAAVPEPVAPQALGVLLVFPEA